MGTGQVWVFDPETQKVWVSTADGVTEWAGGVLRVPGMRIELDPGWRLRGWLLGDRGRTGCAWRQAHLRMHAFGEDETFGWE